MSADKDFDRMRTLVRIHRRIDNLRSEDETDSGWLNLTAAMEALEEEMNRLVPIDGSRFDTFEELLRIETERASVSSRRKTRKRKENARAR